MFRFSDSEMPRVPSSNPEMKGETLGLTAMSHGSSLHNTLTHHKVWCHPFELLFNLGVTGYLHRKGVEKLNRRKRRSEKRKIFDRIFLSVYRMCSFFRYL